MGVALEVGRDQLLLGEVEDALHGTLSGTAQGAVDAFHCCRLLGGHRQIHHADVGCGRSEEHTSELQSLAYLVCRLLLEKKKKYLTFTRGTIMNASQLINCYTLCDCKRTRITHDRDE